MTISKNASFSNRFVLTTQSVSNNNVSVWYNITVAMVVLVAHYAIYRVAVANPLLLLVVA